MDSHQPLASASAYSIGRGGGGIGSVPGSNPASKSVTASSLGERVRSFAHDPTPRASPDAGDTARRRPVRARFCQHGPVDETRVDKWLWAVRVFKTRALATAACKGGHVRVNGVPAKAAATVRVGDRVEARAHGDLRVLEVARVIDKRVGAPLAAECVVDHSPPPAPREQSPDVFVRDRGTGRPTKRDRRQLDRFRTR